MKLSAERKGSRPLLSRSGCISRRKQNDITIRKWFSSPFIEERLYFELKKNFSTLVKWFSSPFIEERLYLMVLLLQL